MGSSIKKWNWIPSVNSYDGIEFGPFATKHAMEWNLDFQLCPESTPNTPYYENKWKEDAIINKFQHFFSSKLPITYLQIIETNMFASVMKLKNSSQLDTYSWILISLKLFEWQSYYEII